MYCHGVMPRQTFPAKNQSFFDWGHPYNPVETLLNTKEECIELYQKTIKQHVKKPQRKRETPLQIRLTAQEKKKIEGLAKACKLSMSEMARQLIMGAKVRAVPPEEFYKILEEMQLISEKIEFYADTPQLYECSNEVINCMTDFKRFVMDFYGGAYGDN